MDLKIGSRIRAERKKRKLTLHEMSRRTGLTPSFLSQVERGKSSLSVDSLKKIADALGLRIADLFETSDRKIKVIHQDKLYVVRKNERKKLIINDRFYLELLTPDLNRKIEFVIDRIAPGATSGDGYYSHVGEECGMILYGKMKWYVGDECFVLEEGDSISFNSEIPHRWENIGDSEASTIWAITPPSY